MREVEAGLKNGVLVVVMSQCRHGLVTEEYEAGKKLISMGAVLGADMTKEAILAKLSYLLAKKLPLHKLKVLMNINLKGELTEPNELNRQTNTWQMHKQYSKLYKKTRSVDALNEINKHWPKFISQTIQQGNI